MIPDGWTQGLQGVSIERSDADGVLLVMQPGTDPQAILRAALAAGPVEHFGFESGGLLEVYRGWFRREPAAARLA